MRVLAFWGFASAIALAAAASAGAADSAAGRSAMATGTAPAGQGWGGVPDVGLNRPAPPQGAPGSGWGAQGWQGGNRPPPPGAAAGGPPPGRPMGPPPGGLADGRGRPDGWRGDRMPHGAGWQVRGGYGPNHGPVGGAWSGRYNRVGRGYVVPGYLRAPNFAVSNWWSYGLVAPGYGQSWIRYYDDALLLDGGGRVVDTRYGLDWEGYAAGPGYPDYGYGDGYEPGNYDRGFHGDRDGVDVYRSGPGAPNVTVHRGGGGSTVVIVQNPSTVTTTTTYYDEVVGSGHRGWKPAKRWKSKLRCNC